MLGRLGGLGQRLRQDPIPPALAEARVSMLYQRLPTALVSVLIAVLLTFIFLLDPAGEKTIKAWTAYMLSTVALRAWLWFVRRGESFIDSPPWRWELAAAAGALLTGIGWAMLYGPLYPQGAHGEMHHFVELLTVAIIFASAINNSSSTPAYLAIVVPTLTPAFIRYWNDGDFLRYGSVPMLATLLAIGLLLQRNLAALELDNLRRRIESEAQLAEHRAILESTALGIALVAAGKIVRSNRRLGELLGRKLRDLVRLPLATHFVSPPELQRLRDESAAAFTHARDYRGMFRLRRADGSEFWAELSGHAMAPGDTRSVWTIADVTLQAGAQRHR